jgi:Zn finger protein HypA/HybF involved in hydrogenase expression
MNVFEVALKCNNCGNVWAKQFEANDRVNIEGIANPKVVVRKKNNASMESSMHFIDCPVCNADDIQVLSRIPLKDKGRTVTSIPPE